MCVLLTYAKLPEINYQKPVKIKIRCKGTTKIWNTQEFLQKKVPRRALFFNDLMD